MKGDGKKPKRLYVKLESEFAVALSSGSTLVSITPTKIGKINDPQKRMIHKSIRPLPISFTYGNIMAETTAKNPANKQRGKANLEVYPPHFVETTPLTMHPIIGEVMAIIPKYDAASFCGTLKI